MDQATDRVSFFRRWIPIAAVTIAGVLLLAGAVIALYAESSYKDQKADEVSVQAQILASTVTAALAFNDRAAAQEYVNAMAANPEIRAAAVYDAGGSLFASYTRGNERLPQAPGTLRPQFEDDTLVVTSPVAQENARLGTVYLRTVIEPVHQRLLRYGGVVLLVTMASLVVAVLGTAHAALTRANLALQSRAEDLAEANRRLQDEIEQRERAEAELRQAQKMETIGQLTGGVAHDFNNLLTIISGNLERLDRRLQDGAAPGQLKHFVTNAIRGADRAAALTRSLLAFSRRQPLNPKPVDVNRLVSGMSDLLRRSLGERITIETVVAGGLWQTYADPNQLENAILNLAVNARDAMPDGGKLTIETANAHLDANYTQSQAEVAPGQYVVLCISDTGVGMSEEVVEQAFEPFFTTKDVSHGTGLGLSQVYGFVKQSGGHVKIYSKVGEGTTVKIYLPRLLAAAAEAEPMQASALPPRGNPDETVLVVEDEDGVRENSCAILRELGYRVLEAGAGREALDILERHPETALLFTDVGLPGGMDGRQLADEATRQRTDLKVLFTTGYARNAIIHEGRLDRGVRLITKPFSYPELATAVRELLDSRTDPPCILVVEDDFLVRMHTVELLQELGCGVLEAATAQDGLNRARALDRDLDAAIIDLGLPDRRGDGLAAELRAMYAKLPIVIASGYAEDELKQRFSEDPLVSLLSKPFQIQQLASALRSAGVIIAGR